MGTINNHQKMGSNLTLQKNASSRDGKKNQDDDSSKKRSNTPDGFSSNNEMKR